MSGNKEQKEWIGYQDPNIYHIEFPYPWSTDNPREFFKTEINKLLTKEKIDPKKDLCGFMLETFQGWGAVFYPKEFVEEIFAFAKDNDLLITFDEMQSGFGRTGKLFDTNITELNQTSYVVVKALVQDCLYLLF